jgi:hypothetical protein
METEKNCNNCQYFKPVHHIDSETKEVKTEIWCTVANHLMKNNNPCKLHQTIF